VKVLAEKCSTCIFRPGNLMRLRPGRVKSMLAECELEDTHIICHETSEEMTGTRRNEAVCRGFIEAGGSSSMLRLGEGLDMIEEVKP